MLTYGEKVCRLSIVLSGIYDARKKPRILTGKVLRSALAMFVSRLGSLNALEQLKASPFLKDWLGGPVPSPDSIGRIFALIAPDSVRLALRALYLQLKRNKTIAPPRHGLFALVVDGHESHASYKHRCDGCLRREVRTATGTRTQFYHRSVSAMLLSDGLAMFLDSEPQLPGEDEVATAMRLLGRVLNAYPRAFDVVLADALYTDPRFFTFLHEHGKDVLTVLKENQHSLLQEARTLAAMVEPSSFSRGRKAIECRDMGGFSPWPQIQQALRVVCARERSTIKRQLDGKQEEQISDWFWLTTLDPRNAKAEVVVELGHNRWFIENQGFNETANQWHADHLYKHEPTAILVFQLLCLMAHALFHAFWRRNLKPALKAKVTMCHVARMILEELYRGLGERLPRPP